MFHINVCVCVFCCVCVNEKMNNMKNTYARIDCER